MEEKNKALRIIFEEVKAVKVFLISFYLIYFLYDFFYYYIFPKSTGTQTGLPTGGLGIGLYFAILMLLPIAIYMIKKGNPYSIKYLYFYFVTTLDIINNFLIYFRTEKAFASGNGVEVLLILLIPIFVNKYYFWTVATIMVLKYILYGFLFNNSAVLGPIVIFLILLISSFILLNRFSSYLKAIKDAYEEMQQKEKLVVIGQMATAIGHEIRNPLAALRGFTQLQQETYPDQNQFYPIMIQEIDRINSIVSDLMIIGKPKALNLKKWDMHTLLSYVSSIVSQQAASQNVTLKINIDKSAPEIYCDDKQMKQVLINILKNAIESMEKAGEVSISSKLEKDMILIAIKDQGSGISENDKERIGEAFYTTKSDGNGLGLMVSQHIVKEHGGYMDIQSEKGNGTLVNIYLPN